jgi:C_GCAxxG_C_C family probable redox protein
VSNDLLSQKALAHFKGGYNCAQSVLLVLTEHISSESNNRVIPKIAAGFGSGMGGCGSVCGALIGGVMAVGIEYGSNDADPKKRAEANKYAQKLYRQFEGQHGCVLCKDLKVNKKVCTALVESVIEAYLTLGAP